MPDERRGWPHGFATTVPDRDALLVLSHLETILPRELHSLAWREGSATACLAAVRGGAGSPSDRGIAAAVDVVDVRSRLRVCGARFVVAGDAGYPEALLDLPDPPGWLYVRGAELPASSDGVAVVGARAASPYGRDAAALIGSAAAAAGVVVISGAARGIDASAHRGALDAGGLTIAILGSGIDMLYPRSSTRLLERIASEGIIVSEYPPGMHAGRRRFPARNRIVAALARAVVVVEGTDRSGSLITADLAEQIQRSILAVPGPIDNPLSAAPHGLIRDGARIVMEPDDVLRELGIIPEADGNAVAEPPGLSEEERALFRCLSGSPATLEALARASGVPPGAALALLSGLELRGLVAAEGGRYRRAPVPPRRQKRSARQTSSEPWNAEETASAVTG
ncbi:MAG: DNA-processing protein DprA [Actinomycetota bacterium]|nr:DNA-processing protein DprA [Actinomycetota bacterium]